MFDLNGIWSSNKKFKISTGLSLEDASHIFKDFELLLNEKRKKNSNKNIGRPAKLSVKDIFLMLLIFIRHYPTFEFLSVIFDLDVSNVKRWIDDSHDVLGDVLVKKNFAHLIALNHQRLQETDLGNSEKHILMELNNLFEGHKIQ